jgi:rubrerythrin
MVGQGTASLQATARTHARAGASRQTSGLWQLRLEQGNRVEIQCAHCGYGAVVTSPPRRCPMCGGDGWRFARRLHALPALSD